MTKTYCAGFFAWVGAGLCAGALVGCGDGGKVRNVVEAAAIYEANKAVFASIRAAYPGPYGDFTRIPARNPADETAADKAFVKLLREQIPVEHIDFFPIGDTGADEMDVVLSRTLTHENAITVSVVFFGAALTLADEHDHMKLFDACDQRALDWLDSRRDDGETGVFCKLDASWYAFQRVE